MRRTISWFWICAIFTFASRLSPAGHCQEAPTPSFRLALREAPKLRYPATAQSDEERLLTQSLFEGLTEFTPDSLEPVGAAAKSWTIASDKRTYFFFLRDDARWSDGRRVTPGDFVAGWKRTLKYRHAIPEASLILEHVSNSIFDLDKELVGSQEVTLEAEVIGEEVLKVTLSYPIEYFLHLLTLPIFYPWPSSIKIETATDFALPPKFPTNGAFVWESGDDQRIVLSKNPHYWGSRQVQLPGVEMLVESNPFLVLQNFDMGKLDWTGTLDLASLPSNQWKNRAERVIPGRTIFYYLALPKEATANTPAEPTAALRRGLSLAIKRSHLGNYVVVHGKKDRAGFFPSLSGNPAPQFQLAYDIKGAKQELKDAGYCSSSEKLNNCQPLPAVALDTRDEVSKKIAFSVCDMWVTGLKLDCKVQEASDSPADTSRLHFTVSSTTVDLPLIEPFLEKWSTRGSRQLHLSFRELVATVEPKKKAPIRKGLERLLVQEIPVIPLISTEKVGVVGKKVLGFYKNALDIHPLKYVYFKSTKQ